MKSLAARRAANLAVLTVSSLAALFGIVMLAWVLGDVIVRGAAAINWDFFTSLPAPPGMKGGGLANAIVGTLILTLTAALIAVPAGIMAGIYLSEFGRGALFAAAVRWLADILVSAPSIVVGVFVYLVLVRPMGNFSGLAGAVSLAILMLPVVIRTTEEMLSLVGRELREAALALGSSYPRMMFAVILRAARNGLVTGVMLAVARVAGETAPLLFTSLNSPYWMSGINEPMASLTVTLFNYAMSPYDDWHSLAWGAALLITVSVLTVTVFTRMVLGIRAGRRQANG